MHVECTHNVYIECKRNVYSAKAISMRTEISFHQSIIFSATNLM